jgi:hypothetical protein
MPLESRPDGTGVTKGGVYDGAPRQVGYKWNCPTCGTEHVTPLEDGCPVCAVEIAKAAARQKAFVPVEISETVLRAAILRHPESQYAAGSLRAGGLTPKARRLLIRALNYYAEAHFETAPGDLSYDTILAWARLLRAADLEEIK